MLAASVKLRKRNNFGTDILTPNSIVSTSTNIVRCVIIITSHIEEHSVLVFRQVVCSRILLVIYQKCSDYQIGEQVFELTTSRLFRLLIVVD